MKTIILATSNQNKIDIANKIFPQYGFKAEPLDLDIPEIQSMDVKEVAESSVKFAYDKIKKPVIKTDAGYFISALNGFPGALGKFFNESLSSQDVLNLMKNHDDKSILLKECISYYDGKTLKSFVHTEQCKIADNSAGNTNTFDEIVIRDGFNKVQALCTHEEMIKHWDANLAHYHDMAKFLSAIN